MIKDRNTDFFVFSADTFPIIAGPCVIESERHALEMAVRLAEIRDRLDLQLVFKASFDKANRTSFIAYRGLPIREAIHAFRRIGEETGLPVLTDVHTPDQPDLLREVVDVIQIPAFLCRQTDLLVAAAKTGRPVNVKKGQFMSPWSMFDVITKLRYSGCDDFAITERGTSFGYDNLLVDMRTIPIIQVLGPPIIFDATHSAKTNPSDGRRFISTMARAAIAAGCDGLYIEVYDRPTEALCDPDVQWPLDRFEDLIVELLAFRETYVRTRQKAVKSVD